MGALVEVEGKPILLLRNLPSGQTSAFPLPPKIVDLQLTERGAWVLTGTRGIAERLSFLELRPPYTQTTFYTKGPHSSLVLKKASDRRHLLVKESSLHAEHHFIIPPDGTPSPLHPPSIGEKILDTNEGRLFAFVNTSRGTEIWERKEEWHLRGELENRWYVSSLGIPNGIVFHTKSPSGHRLHRIKDRITDLFIGRPTEVLELRDADENAVRFLSQSLAVPKRVLEIDLASERKIELASLPALTPSHLYREERIEITNRYGIRVPVTLLMKRTTTLPAPLLLIAYGAYGHDLLPTYDPTKLSLANEGFVVGLVHARGGGEKGPEWHKAAMKTLKGATANDIIDTARSLTERGIGQRSNVYLRGRSAGAIAIAAAAAEEPHLIKGIILDNPYLDLYGALQDRSDPLVLREMLEWGDPHTIGSFQKAFSPLARRYASHLKALLSVSTVDDITPLSEAMNWIKILRKLRGTDVVLNISTTASHFGEGAATRALEEECLKIEVLKHWSSN